MGTAVTFPDALICLDASGPIQVATGSLEGSGRLSQNGLGPGRARQKGPGMARDSSRLIPGVSGEGLSGSN